MTGLPPGLLLAFCLVASVLAGCGSYTGTVSETLGVATKDVSIDLHRYQVAERGNNRVYYAPDTKPLADSVLPALARQEAFLARTLELKAVSGFGVVIVWPPEENARYHVPAPRGWSIWTLRVLDPTTLSTAGEFEQIHHTLLHERTENAVEHALYRKEGLYDFNPQARWIGDGLAEWVAYRYCRRNSPIAAAHILAGYHESVKGLREQWHVRHVDLREFRAWVGSADEVKHQWDAFRRYPDVTVAYYPMSFTYWATLEREKGVAGVREIVTRLRALQQPTNENIDRLIRETAGERFLERIGRMDTTAALAFIDGEIVALIPQLREELRSADYGTRNAARDAFARLGKDDFQHALAGMPTTARIVDVIPGSPAHRAGLQAGMIIDAVDGETIGSFDTFLSRVNTSAERSMTVSVFHRGGKKTLMADAFAGSRFESVPR